MNLKYAINKILARFGYKVQKTIYSQSMGEYIRAVVYPSIDCYVDVGANIGQTYQGVRADGFKGEIRLVEPIEECHAAIEEKIKNDPLAVLLPPMALGSADAEVLLNVSQDLVSSSILPVRREEGTPVSTNVVASAPVKVRRFDGITDFGFDVFRSMCIKIDVQGFELEVLNGITDFSVIRYVIVELSVADIYEGQAGWYEVVTFLRRKNFVLRHLEPTITNTNGELLQFDVIWERAS